jgi:hypothetical protein
LDLLADSQIDDATRYALAHAVGKLGKGNLSLAQELLMRLSDDKARRFAREGYADA